MIEQKELRFDSRNQRRNQRVEEKLQRYLDGIPKHLGENEPTAVIQKQIFDSKTNARSREEALRQHMNGLYEQIACKDSSSQSKLSLIGALCNDAYGNDIDPHERFQRYYHPTDFPQIYVEPSEFSLALKSMTVQENPMLYENQCKTTNRASLKSNAFS